ncbi:hypothetical protein [Acinetobacter soli]|uniref:hypothetical protein n=1 Tax=Acinetobacter soli TaxID=487316 RepID=UPI0012509456|nr:hypothetical protein [Acinetobacter soli]
MDDKFISPPEQSNKVRSEKLPSIKERVDVMDLWIVETCAQNITGQDVLEAVCISEDKANNIAQEIENKKTNEFLTVIVRKVQANDYCGPFRHLKLN